MQPESDSDTHVGIHTNGQNTGCMVAAAAIGLSCLVYLRYVFRLRSHATHLGDGDHAIHRSPGCLGRDPTLMAAATRASGNRLSNTW